MPEKRLTHIAFLLMLILVAGLCGSSAALAAAGVKAKSSASSIKMLSEDDREITWNLNADRMLTASGGTVLEAFGKVELKMGDDYLRADFARYFANTNWVYLYGNVELKLGDDILQAQEAEFDLRSRTGWLTEGSIFIAENNTYFAAERIIKHRGGTYSFTNLKFTTCDGEAPAWSLAADTAVLEMDGYAQLWKTRFQVVDQPVLYSPYLIVPAKSSRQSGFLMPDAGHSSKLGYFYTQPFYWVIDSSRDVTFTESYMSKRGFMHGFNYRSRGSEDESLWISFDYLYDEKTVTNPNDKYYSGDGLVRNNHSRYWLRGMYDVRMPGDPLWRFRADVDYVSDQYYLRDFKRGMQGYDKNRNALFDTFSRDLREKDDTRQSGAMFFRDWDRAGLYLSAMYNQDPTLGNGNTPRSKDTTVQQVPELNLYLQQGRLIDALPLEFSGSGQAAYLYRREDTSGTRFDLSPRITLPISGRYGSVIASAGLHATWYRTEKRHEAAAPVSGSSSDEKSRYIPEFEISGSTELARVYSLDNPPLQEAGESRWVGIKHSVVPRLTYLHVPDEEQSRTPYFTSYDYIAPRHELIWSLDNVFTRKRERMLERVDERTNEVETYSQYDYQDLFRLRLEQAYSLYEARRGHDRDEYPREPWRDIMAELTVYWDEQLSFFSRSYWTPSEDGFTSHSHGVSLNLPKWGTFSTSLDYRKPVNDYYTRRGPHYGPTMPITERLTTASFRADMHLWGPWTASAYYDWDIKGQGKNEKGLTIMYNHQCFSLGGQIIRDEDDTIFRIQFSLSGLGI